MTAAHYNQRQAEAKERIGQYSSALEFRKIALENLKTALTSSCDHVVQNSIKLQIIQEEKQIEQFYRLASEGDDLKRFVKGNDLHKNMSQSSLPQQRFIGPASEVIQNTEKIGTLLAEIKLELDDVKEDVSDGEADSIPKQTNVSSRTSKHDLVPFQDILCTLGKLKDYNNKNLLLIRTFFKEFSLLQKENANLKAKVEDLEIRCESLTLSEQDQKAPSESGDFSPFILFPMGENYVPHPLSVEEFAPLDCPSLDFLNQNKEDVVTYDT